MKKINKLTKWLIYLVLFWHKFAFNLEPADNISKKLLLGGEYIVIQMESVLQVSIDRKLIWKRFYDNAFFNIFLFSATWYFLSIFFLWIRYSNEIIILFISFPYKNTINKILKLCIACLMNLVVLTLYLVSCR